MILSFLKIQYIYQIKWKIFAINLIKIRINDARQTLWQILQNKPYLIKLQKKRYKILPTILKIQIK